MNTTNSLVIRKASKKQTKLKIGISGPSGSGKTYSALLMAHGLADDWDKVFVIDTENGSADLYSDFGQYNVITLAPPFSPEKYIEAIRMCEQAGAQVIVVDSMTHEWDGKGGALDIHDQMTGNSYTNWAKITPRHNAFVDAILQSPCHMVCTMRSKQDYVLVEKNGKQVPEKVGLKAITREGIEYEFTLVFDLDIKHFATATKDRTKMFQDKPAFVVEDTVGLALRNWGEEGEVVPVKPVTPPTPKSQLPPKYMQVTATQKQQYFDKAKEAGFNEEQAIKIAMKKFSLETMDAFTSTQCGSLCRAMDKRIEEQKKKEIEQTPTQPEVEINLDDINFEIEPLKGKNEPSTEQTTTN